jgi:hypothetical protein
VDAESISISNLHKAQSFRCGFEIQNLAGKFRKTSECPSTTVSHS